MRTFARIGFGGPAGQIALMHRDLVDERGWIAEEDFLHALNVFDWRAALLAALVLLLVFAARWTVLRVLGVAAAGGLLLGLAT